MTANVCAALGQRSGPRKVLTKCAHRITDHWHSGSRDPYHIEAAKRQAASTIEVLRELGYLNDHGIKAARDELGPLGAESLDRLVKGWRDDV
jgi:hypothetical protein